MKKILGVIFLLMVVISLVGAITGGTYEDLTGPALLGTLLGNLISYAALAGGGIFLLTFDGIYQKPLSEGIQLRIISGDKNINYGSVYENAVAQELVAHGITPYYYNSKKRGEVDFLIELGGKALPIEVKSGKDYEIHRALSNIMDCSDYDLPEAIVLNNDNLRKEGKFVYAPVYMTMFIQKADDAPVYYKVDLSGLD